MREFGSFIFHHGLASDFHHRRHESSMMKVRSGLLRRAPQGGCSANAAQTVKQFSLVPTIDAPWRRLSPYTQFYVGFLAGSVAAREGNRMIFDDQAIPSPANPIRRRRRQTRKARYGNTEERWGTGRNIPHPPNFGGQANGDKVLRHYEFGFSF